MPTGLDAAYRRLPELVGLLLALAVQWRLYLASRRRWAHARASVIVLACLAAGLVVVGFLPASVLPYWGFWPWLKAAGFAWAVVTTVAALLLAAWAWLEAKARFHPSRRRLLTTAKSLTVAAPALALGYGVIAGRRDIQLREVEIPIPNLPPDLHGLKLVQITDIHLGPYFEPADLERAIAIASETRAQVGLITGDLVTARRDPLHHCIALLRRLRVDAELLGCLGNHEIHAQCESEAEAAAARAGIRFLRSTYRVLRFGDARLNIAGVDYQRKFEPYLAGAEQLLQPGMPNILLSHNPDVFPVAVAKGFDLTVAGHTHGGQITVEILGHSASLARFYTPYVYGRYELNGRSIYVSRGLGTVGVPARVGAPPEVSLIKLCAT
jgi:predicted MPP superfamily phosphohydrolase